MAHSASTVVAAPATSFFINIERPRIVIALIGAIVSGFCV
jgi:hypothetical protein